MKRIGKQLNEHWTQKRGYMKAKLQFKTLDECLNYMKEHKINMDKYHPYVCSDCGMWHIGHNKENKNERDLQTKN